MSGRKVTAGDALLLVAGVALASALAWPRVSDARVRALGDAVATEVEALRAAAVRHHAETASWPPDAEPGTLPEELSALVPAELVGGRASHRLDWDRWELVEPPPTEPVPAEALEEAPPPPDTVGTPEAVFHAIGAVTVHADDPRILGLLLERYGPERSFVRASSWTLVLTGEDARR